MTRIMYGICICSCLQMCPNRIAVIFCSLVQGDSELALICQILSRVCYVNSTKAYCGSVSTMQQHEDCKIY